MSQYSQIGFGDIADRSDKELNGDIIICFDIDWAPDFILEDSLELAKRVGIRPTLFLTHHSPLCQEIFAEQKFEFGLHPNFEKLLSGDDSNGRNAGEVIDRLNQFFPGIKVIRSHSLTTSSRLKAIFKKNNFEIESSFVTQQTGKTFPNFWDEWTGLRQVPITWEDDVWFSSNKSQTGFSIKEIVRKDVLNVLTFHPIHLYLNTVDQAHYERSKPWIADSANLIKCRLKSDIGVRAVFKRVGALLKGQKDARY